LITVSLKKLGSAGRFGARYGRKLKKKIIEVEKLQKKRQKCPYCTKLGTKRLSSGIWYCKKCDSKFTGKAYLPA